MCQKTLNFSPFKVLKLIITLNKSTENVNIASMIIIIFLPCIVSKLVHRLNKTTTTSWGCWKHVFGIPGARPIFLKAEMHKKSKNGFKTMNSRPPSVMIFSKNCFRSKKIIKKIGRFIDFWIFMPIYMNNLDQFLKI